MKAIYLERKDGNMSFNHAMLNNDFFIVGSDSRDTFSDGTYTDNRQKTYVNKELKLCWSYTGLSIYHNVDLIKIIKDILDLPVAIEEKLFIIQGIMTIETERYYKETNQDIYFDLFVGINENHQNALYILEVKNGLAQIAKNKKYNEKYHVSSGVHTEFQDHLNLIKMQNINTAVPELDRIIKLVMGESAKSDNTVGGDTYIAVMDNQGNIRAYINGVETNF